jgi:cytochrome P450
VIADPATYAAAVPHPEFDRLRRTTPVSWVEEPLLARRGGEQPDGLRRGSGFWAVTDYAGVLKASRSPATFSSAARGAFLADPQTGEDLARARQLLVNMDAPEHHRVRRYVAGAFTPRVVQELAESIRLHAQALVEKVRASGEFDAVADLAAELPLLVLTDLLGLPQADRGLLLGWSNNLVGFDDPQFGGGDIAAYRRTFHEAFAYARELGADRRRNPGEDLVSRLVTYEVDGRRLSDPQFCQLWLLLVIAGNETTRQLLSGSLLALVENPEQLAHLVQDQQLTASAVDELLRWVSPIMQFRRTAVEDTQLSGQTIAAGDKVVLYYVSANRDESVFAAPDQLDLGRKPNPHLAFGVGSHYCLGSHLAHLEARVLLDTLRPHLPRLRATGPAIRLESNFMNGIKSLPMALAG